MAFTDLVAECHADLLDEHESFFLLLVFVKGMQDAYRRGALDRVRVPGVALVGILSFLSSMRNLGFRVRAAQW